MGDQFSPQEDEQNFIEQVNLDDEFPNGYDDSSRCEETEQIPLIILPDDDDEEKDTLEKKPELPESSILPDLRDIWKLWTRGGIPQNEKKELIEKYSPPVELKTPEINEEILVTLHKRPLDKDKHIFTSQELLSSALTALGTTMSTLLVGNEKSDSLKVINGLNDTAKILTELFYTETIKRRAQLMSWKSIPLRGVLAETKPDEFLFGKHLRDKINEAQRIGRIGPLKPYVKPKNKKKRYKSFPSPYWDCDRNYKGEEEPQNFVINPMKKEVIFVCKKEEFPTIKLE